VTEARRGTAKVLNCTRAELVVGDRRSTAHGTRARGGGWWLSFRVVVVAVAAVVRWWPGRSVLGSFSLAWHYLDGVSPLSVVGG
jgi:hypothetical protein